MSALYDQLFDLSHYTTEATRHLGKLHKKSTILSRMAPFLSFPEYHTHYPETVVQALFELYLEYNQTFKGLIEQNREWETDYRYCFDESGNPLNRWVQIDMVGLPDSFLTVASVCTISEVKSALRNSIFEIENSLAMYQLLERILPALPFRRTFRSSLQELRNQYGLPIALLAVTDQKYHALRADEFGVGPNDILTSEMIRELSGFDRLFAPEEFRQHVVANGGKCDYLLYVRSSDPVTKLKKPETTVDHPLLSDPEMRRVIKEYSLTFNIDNPEETDTARLINDTKAYMPIMKLGMIIQDESDLLSEDVLNFIRNGGGYESYNGERLSPRLKSFLANRGVDAESIATGKQLLRAKPLQGTYGCYGHHSLSLTDRRARSELRADLRKRGSYIIQPELPTPFVVDPDRRETYGYIDRNFVTTLRGEPVFMGGFRSLLPLVSREAKKGRYHGNKETVWAGIIGT
jgi:hypothetical protein